MRPTLLSLTALALAGCITSLPEVDDPCGEWDQTGIFSYNVDIDGKRRESYVYVPPNSTGPRDIVFLLHGAGVDARTMAEATKHIALANKKGFVGVFPQGTNPVLRHPAWNAGDCCLTADEQHRDEADVQFMNTLARDLKKKTCSEKLFVTGFSNGGMLSHRWACESDQVDALVPIGGGPRIDACKGDPIPLRHYHGMDDPIIPVDGNPERDVPKLKPSLSIWLDRNQCTSNDPVEVTTQGKMTCEHYDCAVPTELCLIDDWKHQWPGGIHADSLGSIDATVDGYEFFLETTGGSKASSTSPTGTTTPTGTTPTDTGI